MSNFYVLDSIVDEGMKTTLQRLQQDIKLVIIVFFLIETKLQNTSVFLATFSLRTNWNVDMKHSMLFERIRIASQPPSYSTHYCQSSSRPWIIGVPINLVTIPTAIMFNLSNAVTIKLLIRSLRYSCVHRLFCLLISRMDQTLSQVLYREQAE